MITLLRIFFGALTLTMTAVVIATCMESNLFTEWAYLSSIPWMTATLKDFYSLMIPFALWMMYKESSWGMRTIWVVAFVCLGSIGTSAYMVRRLWVVDTSLSPELQLSSLLLREPHP